MIGASPIAGLIWTLVRTDFKTRYHGTLGGFFWALLKPLTMFFVLMGVFSYMFASDPNFKINLIIGLFLYDFFSEATKSGIVSLREKAFLLTKAKFRTWVVVFTSSSNALINLSLFAITVTIFIHVFKRPVSFFEALVFFGYLFQFWMLVFGFSLASSVLFLIYRDLNQIWELTLQAGFFVAPVIYPLGIIPEEAHKYLYVWLPTAVIQFSRSVLVDGIIVSNTAHGLLLASVVIVMAVGIVIYRSLGAKALEKI
jgi:ABC-2 type transport system permease protein